MSSYILDYDSKKKVATLTSSNLDLIREHFSIEDPNAKFARRQGYKFIPTRKFIITPAGRFEVGLTLDIYKKIRQVDPEGTIQITDSIKNLIMPKFNVSMDNIINTSNLELRPYQAEVVRQCIKRGRGMVVVATAGGKTIIMSTLISTLRLDASIKKIVVIVPTHLAKQTYDEFLTYRPTWSTSWWTGEHAPDKSCDVIIAGSNILLSKQQDVSWLFDADLLIFDEAHTARHSNKINKILKKFNTNYRFGFTGTMPEDLLDQWTVKGLIGPVIIEKTSAELRNDNYISDVQVRIIELKHLNPPSLIDISKSTDQYRAEIDFIICSEFRNNIIKKIAVKCDNNVLILVDRIEHGEILKYILSGSSDKDVFFIRGEVETDERDRVKSIMESNNNIICIAITSIFSTGINIKNLHYIIFAAGGKAKIKIIQSIGRGLRLHKDKKGLIIFDIFDSLKYGKRHYAKRIILYEKEKIKYSVKCISEQATGSPRPPPQDR